MKYLGLLLPIVILALVLRGLPGNPTAEELNKSAWSDSGPLELSVERGRFALTYSLAESRSFFFSLPVARFSTPDLGYKNGHYVSLFAPAVSFLAVPGYLLGKVFGASQLGAFATSSLFALVNFVLVAAISRRLDAHPAAAYLAACAFLFATPALAYSATLYQHHFSTFLILAGIYTLMRWDNIWSTAAVWFLCATAISIDYPNLILLFPIGLTALGRIIRIDASPDHLRLKFNFRQAISFLSLVPPLLFFFWFNWNSYGNIWQLAGTVPAVSAIDDAGLPTTPRNLTATQDPEKFLHPEIQKKSALRYFRTRNVLNGLYIHLLSPDRGLIVFTPVILLGLLGAYFLYKLNHPYLSELVAVLGADLVLYSLWGDAWGGWAFGSRYLIPGYAVLAVLLGVALTKLRKSFIFLLIFEIMFIYSISVNVLGAITTSRNPPQVEVAELQKISNRVEKYSYDRNLSFLKKSGSKSFVYLALARKYLSPSQYYLIISALIGLVSVLFLARLKEYAHR